MWMLNSPVGVRFRSVAELPAGMTAVAGTPPSTERPSVRLSRVNTTWCHPPSLYEEGSVTSVEPMSVPTVARRTSAVPVPGSARTEKCRPFLSGSVPGIPYAHTIGSVPVVAVCRNQAVTVKFRSSTRREGEQTRRR